MGYIFHNFLNTLKHYKVSSLLNILGMTVAFAAFYVIMRRYLSGYAYHTALSWWVFAAALLAVLCLTVGIVTLRSWSVATANPVEKLKTE